MSVIHHRAVFIEGESICHPRLGCFHEGLELGKINAVFAFIVGGIATVLSCCIYRRTFSDTAPGIFAPVARCPGKCSADQLFDPFFSGVSGHFIPSVSQSPTRCIISTLVSQKIKFWL